jgi:hypothetical protein
VIAQIDEDEVAVIALLVDPAGDTDLFANLFGAEGGAVVGAIGVHVSRLSCVVPAKAGISCGKGAPCDGRSQLSLG